MKKFALFLAGASAVLYLIANAEPSIPSGCAAAAILVLIAFKGYRLDNPKPHKK